MRAVPIRPPPRSASLPLRLHVLLGGFFNIFGWAFFAFGMIFVWGFVGSSELVTVFKFMGERGVVTGSIERVEETSAAENDEPIRRVVYAYSVDGRSLTGSSYTVDDSVAAGQTVEVEYMYAEPSTSRARGMRSETFPIWIAFVLIFPMIGAGFIVSGFRSGRRAIRLLEHGQLGYGKLVAKEPTNTRINEQTVYELTFEFEDEGRRLRRAKARSHRPHELEDEEREPLLYDPMGDGAVMLDGLPGRPEVDPQGDLIARNNALAFAVVALPALTIIVHGGYLVFVVVL